MNLKQFEGTIQKQLHANSIVFLKDGIERLVNQDNEHEDFIAHDLLILTCTSFQISIELAIKALIIEREGIRAILNPKQRKYSDEEIEKLFGENKLKTADFDIQKNFIKTKKFIWSLTKEDYETIDGFQNYRNKIVHFSYKFAEGDMYDLKYDLIYYLVNIIFKILLSNANEDVKPSEFVIEVLGRELSKKLINYRPYVEAMQRLARENSREVFNCIFCNQRAFSQDQEHCYCCSKDYEGYAFINCDYCEKKKSLIYDDLNLSENHNTAKGLCLNCGSDGIIFHCPECDIAYNIETKFNNICTDGNCVNK